MKLNRILMAASCVWLLVSFWNRNDLPRRIEPLPQLREQPVQKPTGRQPFDVTYEDVRYHVEPEFAYDITGLVVSYRHHDNNSRLHALANDHLNMLDVCVIWGENLDNVRLHKLRFWDGIFTCNVRTRDQRAWDAFDMTQLSNNHLLSDDNVIRRQVRKLRVGDQIRVRGYLSGYAADGGSRRGTSTTRNDRGDGACETIYVQDFRILRAAAGLWRISMWTSLVLLLAGLVIHFRQPYRPY